MVRNIWVGKWLEIMRAATMAANRGGYKSAAEIRETGRQEWLQRPGTLTRVQCDAISEYACALEAENASLKSGGSDKGTIRNLEAASAATKTTTGLLAEMHAAHAAQMREMTALLAAVTAGNAPAPPPPPRK